MGSMIMAMIESTAMPVPVGIRRQVRFSFEVRAPRLTTAENNHRDDTTAPPAATMTSGVPRDRHDVGGGWLR